MHVVWEMWYANATGLYDCFIIRCDRALLSYVSDLLLLKAVLEDFFSLFLPFFFYYFFPSCCNFWLGLIEMQCIKTLLDGDTFHLSLWTTTTQHNGWLPAFFIHYSSYASLAFFTFAFLHFFIVKPIRRPLFSFFSSFLPFGDE